MAQTQYLDKNGLSYFWQKIKQIFVSDITFNSTTGTISKTKSGNDISVVTLATTSTPGLMSAEDKTTLDGIISTGGEPNQNAWSNISVGGNTLEADAKTDTFTIIAGDNITLTSTVSSDSFTISATDTTYTAGSSAQIVAGTSTTNCVYTPKALSDAINSKIATAITGAASFQGTVSIGTDISGLNSYSKGQYWIVGTAGTYVGQNCQVGDMIFCISDYNSAYSASDFSVVQNNLDIGSIATNDIDTIVAS